MSYSQRRHTHVYKPSLTIVTNFVEPTSFLLSPSPTGLTGKTPEPDWMDAYIHIAYASPREQPINSLDEAFMSLEETLNELSTMANRYDYVHKDECPPHLDEELQLMKTPTTAKPLTSIYIPAFESLSYASEAFASWDGWDNTLALDEIPALVSPASRSISSSSSSSSSYSSSSSDRSSTISALSPRKKCYNQSEYPVSYDKLIPSDKSIRSLRSQRSRKRLTAYFFAK